MLLRSALHGSEAFIHIRRVASLIVPVMSLSISRVAEAFPESLAFHREVRRSVTSDHPMIAPVTCLNAVRLADAVSLFAAWVLCQVFYPTVNIAPSTAAGSLAAAGIVTTLVSIYAALMVLNLSGKYQLDGLVNKRITALQSARAAAAFAVTSSLSIYLVSGQLASPVQFALPGVFAFLLVSASDMATSRLIGRLKAAGKLGYRVAVLGSGAVAAEASTLLAALCGDTITLTGTYNSEIGAIQAAGHNVFHGDIADLIAESRRYRLDAILLAPECVEQSELQSLTSMLETVLADIYLFRSDAAVTQLAGSEGLLVDGPVLPRSLASRIKVSPISGIHATRKRIFDIVFSATLLMLLTPFLLLIAFAVKAESRGPILFRQPRIGLNRTVFIAYKFRTMFDDMADLHAVRQTSRDDPRVTRVGRILRRFSIDELPQLLNILLGDMSLIGPRPHAPQTTAEGLLLADAVESYDVRHCVKPGLSGWAQVHGWRGQITSIEHLTQRLEHDLFYIRNWSFWLDFKIILLTIKREVVSRHAF